MSTNVLLVINTNLHPISHHFEVIADNWSKFALSWTPKLRTTKFSPKKLETLLYRTVFTYLQTIISFCHNAGEYQLEVAVLEGCVSLCPNISTRRGRPLPTICAPIDRPVNALQLCRWKFSHKETLVFVADFLREIPNFLYGKWKK